MKKENIMFNVTNSYVKHGFIVECIVTRQGVPNTPETFEGIIDTGAEGTCVSEKVMSRIKEALISKNSVPLKPVGIVKMRGGGR